MAGWRNAQCFGSIAEARELAKVFRDNGQPVKIVKSPRPRGMSYSGSHTLGLAKDDRTWAQKNSEGSMRWCVYHKPNG